MVIAVTLTWAGTTKTLLVRNNLLANVTGIFSDLTLDLLNSLYWTAGS